MAEIDMLHAWDKRLTTMEIGREPSKPRLYHYSAWANYIEPDGYQLELLLDEDSLTARIFRNRFGVPWYIYYSVLLLSVEIEFGRKRGACGRDPVPLEFKVLGQMRMIRTGMTFGCIAEITRSGFRGEVHRLFCHRFWAAFVRRFWCEWIQPPSTPEEIAIAMQPYKMTGCDGCGASTDGFNVEWLCCPYDQRNCRFSNTKQSIIYPSWSDQIVLLLL